jgi:hypothetical protein
MPSAPRGDRLSAVVVAPIVVILATRIAFGKGTTGDKPVGRLEE